MIAVPGPVVADLVAEHAGALDGKVVVDAANRMGGDRTDNQEVITGAVPGATIHTR